MMKVAVILERADIALGGAERSVSELTTELRRQGVEATVLAAKGTPSENTVILCNEYTGKRVPLKVFEAAVQEDLKSHSYDIVHSTLPLAIADVYQPRGGCYREAMLQNIASYSCPCERILKRCTHRLNFKRTQYLDAEKKLCTQTNVTVAALSAYVRNHFKKHYDLPDSRIAVIANGVNTNIESDPETDATIKETIFSTVSVPRSKRTVLFLFAANNPPLKGIGPLLTAMQVLPQHSPENVNPILVTAGAKPTRINAKNVVWIGKLDGLSNALSVCDVAVLPTWYDPCSRFILEALAMGKPVITTRFNGACERYTHQKHGIILDRPDDVAALSNALRTFCDHDKIDLAHSAIVDDNLKDEVSIVKHVNSLIGLYEKIAVQKDK